MADGISRSYPVGRQSFSRTCQGRTLTLTITVPTPLPGNVQACLMSTLNSKECNQWDATPFVRADPRTLELFDRADTGLHSFRAEFSLDGGATWLAIRFPMRGS